MAQRSDVSEIKPPPALDTWFHGRAPKLWGVGNPAILSGRLLGIISARQIDSDLALQSYQLLKQLAFSNDFSFVSGWHSPLEEDALRIVLAQEAPLVLCASKALDRFKPSRELESQLSKGKVLLLTHCGPKAKRISREASIRRNQLVVGLAAALLVLSAPEGSASLTLAQSALRLEKPVLTPEHALNKKLLACNALAATIENVYSIFNQ
jgi:predicted Rossmann fold nucleotide-binding protein DprA/Smf involved in DNA uptake